MRAQGKPEIRPITSHLGAEIADVDLSKPLGNEAFDAIHDAFNRHSVLVFHDQDLTPEQHVAFSRRFGPLMVHVFHLQAAFKRMRARHELWIKKFPNTHGASGPAFTGLSNARPETVALGAPPVDLDRRPKGPRQALISRLHDMVTVGPIEGLDMQGQARVLGEGLKPFAE